MEHTTSEKRSEEQADWYRTLAGAYEALINNGRASQSTGFGLTIVSQIVGVHGWTVHVTESEARGARFEITGINGDGSDHERIATKNRGD